MLILGINAYHGDAAAALFVDGVCVAAAAEVKQHGRPNDLLDRLAADEAFAGVDLNAAVDPSKLTGRSAEQVDEFLTEVVASIRDRYSSQLASVVEINV